MKSTDRQIDVCVPFAPVEWGNNTQRGAQAQRIFRGLGLRFLGVRCSSKAKLVEGMGTWNSGGAAGGGDRHFVLPLPVKMPQRSKNNSWIKGPFQLPDLELCWGLGDCQTCALEPSSFSPHLSQAEGQGSTVPGKGFPTWLLSTSTAQETHGSVWCLLFLLSPLLKKAGIRAVVCRDGRDAADTLHVHSILCTDPWALSHHRRVSLLVCVTNWAGQAHPARAAAPAELGTQPAPLEMPPGTCCFCLGLSKVENKP